MLPINVNRAMSQGRWRGEPPHLSQPGEKACHFQKAGLLMGPLKDRPLPK